MRASIITPTFNAERFIDDCVGNVVAQGDVVLEHIIVDGGSTDGTIEKLLQLQKKHPHIRYLPGPDRGQSDAMNKASATAKGEAIGILNVDDYYEPGAVARGLHCLQAFGRPAMVVGDCHIVDESGKVVYINRPKDMRLESLLLDSYLLPIPANPSAYFYSREVHDLVGGYDPEDHYAMDADFIFKCLARIPVRYYSEHWGNFRLIPGAKTHDDPRSAQRLTELIARHKEGLTPRQHSKMRRIWRVRRFKRYVGGLLWRAGLLRS